MGYAVLTGIGTSYLFKQDADGCIKISGAFQSHAEHPTALAAIMFLVHTAVSDNTEYGHPNRNGKLVTCHTATPEPSNQTEVKQDTDQDYTQSMGMDPSGKRLR